MLFLCQCACIISSRSAAIAYEATSAPFVLVTLVRAAALQGYEFYCYSVGSGRLCRNYSRSVRRLDLYRQHCMSKFGGEAAHTPTSIETLAASSRSMRRMHMTSLKCNNPLRLHSNGRLARYQRRQYPTCKTPVSSRTSAQAHESQPSPHNAMAHMKGAKVIA